MNVLPRDAERLLLDPRWLRFACDFTRNRQFWTADARTRDFRGDRLIDSVWPLDTMERTAEWLRETVAALLVGQPVELDPLREVEIAQEGRSPRVVHVATYQRRCLSNLVSRVLAETTRALLPQAVRAYVPGLHDPVPEAILDLAEAVRDGRITWWWKIDFKAYFSRIPHRLIREALHHYGFGRGIAHLVTACIETPIHRRGPGGAWVRTPNRLGAPMGLTESSVIANLVCYALDEHFDRISNRVIQVRYSDDNLGGTNIRSEAMGALRAYRRWADLNGIQVKGRSPDTRTAALLHDIRRERMPALGAEIDQNGNVHIPQKTFVEKLAEVDAAMLAIELHGDRPVEGLSMYSGGRGTAFQDIDDVRESAEAFASYWFRLNQYEAEHFRRVVKKRHPTLLSSTGRLGTVWIASLGGPGGARGEGQGPPAPSLENTTTAPGLGPSRAHGQGPTHGPTGANLTGEQPGDSNTQAQIPVAFEVVALNGTNDRHAKGQEVDPEAGIGTDGVEADRLIGALLGEAEVLVVETTDAHMSIGDTDDDEDADPLHRSEGETCLSQVAEPRLSSELPAEDGAVAEPSSPEPSRGSADDNRVTIAVQWVPRALGGPGTLVRVVHGDPEIAEPRDAVTLFARSCRPESALVRAIEHELRRASARGARRLEIRLEHADLPKHLLQERRRFHNPNHFDAVTRLHRTATETRIRLRLRGGDELPKIFRVHEGELTT